MGTTEVASWLLRMIANRGGRTPRKSPPTTWINAKNILAKTKNAIAQAFAVPALVPVVA